MDQWTVSSPQTFVPVFSINKVMALLFVPLLDYILQLSLVDEIKDIMQLCSHLWLDLLNAMWSMETYKANIFRSFYDFKSI